MALPGIDEIKKLAFKYTKDQLANLAELKLIDPEQALMAGFMRDRIAKEDMQPPSTTVMQDVFGTSQEPQMPQMSGIPQGQPMPPQAMPEQPPMMAASGGLLNLPVGDIGNYAGGGIVAFDDGGEVPGYAGDKGSLIDPAFRDRDPDKKVRLGIFRDELAKAQQRLAAATTQEDRARAQADIDSINREIAAASKSAATRGFGDITKIPQGDPRIAAQREAMSLPAINPPAPSGTDFVPQARGVAEEIYPKAEAPKVQSVTDALKLSNQALTEAGVDLNFYTKQGKGLEKEGAMIAKDREDAKTFRILQGAAGILSGTSPFASVNIGKGVAPAVEGLAADMKEFSKNERALRDAQRKLDTDQQQFNVTRATDALSRVQKSQDRVDKYNEVKAKLVGDITEKFISAQGSKDVAEIYRRQAPLDVSRLADELKADNPNASRTQLLEKAATILRPVGMGPLTNLTNRVIAETTKGLEALELDPTYRKLKEKAAKGDKEAAAEVEQRKQKVRDDVLNWAERTREELSDGIPRRGAPSAAAPQGITPPPEAIAQLKANDTPQMRAYFDHTFGQGAAARALGK